MSKKYVLNMGGPYRGFPIGILMLLITPRAQKNPYRENPYREFPIGIFLKIPYRDPYRDLTENMLSFSSFGLGYGCAGRYFLLRMRPARAGSIAPIESPR